MRRVTIGLPDRATCSASTADRGWGPASQGLPAVYVSASPAGLKLRARGSETPNTRSRIGCGGGKWSAMTYRSPFGDIDAGDHNGEDALCLSRKHCVNAVEDTLMEFHQAAVAAIDSRAPQPAFFLARQLAELALKALHLPGFPAGHNLTALLDSLHQRGD